MGQCIIKDCGFDSQKSAFAQKKNLRNFLTEVFYFLTPKPNFCSIFAENQRKKQRQKPGFHPRIYRRLLRPGGDTIYWASYEASSEHIFGYSFKKKKKKILENWWQKRFFLMVLGDIKEEEEKEEEEFAVELNEIKSLRMLTEKYEPLNAKNKNIFNGRQIIQETSNFGSENESDQKHHYSNQETKLIHNNLRVFLNKEQELFSSNKKNGENENFLLASLALTTSNNKPMYTSNSGKPEMFINENFRKDAMNDSFEAAEKFANIFNDDDYLEEEMQRSGK